MFIKKTSRKASKPGGFSLIELLLVLSLAPIVFFAVYSNFNAGVRLWQRLQIGTPDEDRAIFRIKTQRDFLNAMHFTSIPFMGDEEGVTFAASIVADEKLGGDRAIGQVHYFYDASSRNIMRETKDYSQVYKESPGLSTVMAQNIDSFVMTYLVKDVTAKDYVWQEDYHEKPGTLPTAIKLTYTVKDSAEVYEQTYFISSGGEAR